jgi:hypothetical protein
MKSRGMLGGGVGGSRGAGSGETGEDAQVRSQLEQVYSSGEAKGFSEEEITQKLIAKGWDQDVVEKFLRGR